MFALRVLLLLFGICACSTAAIFIRAAQLHPLLIAAWRLLLGGALLLPVFLIARRRHPQPPLRRLLATALPGAVLLALHFWSWNAGLQRAIIANAALIVNMTAPVMPVVVWLLLRERIGRRELLGTAVAFCGVLALAGHDLDLDPRYFVGDAICFGSMLLFVVYLVYARRSRDLPSIWLYVPPVYLIAGGLCLVAGWVVTGDPLPQHAAAWWPLLGLGVIPTLIGHSILNLSMQRLPSQLVAVLNLLQFLPAAILAWIVFSEHPHPISFPLAVALVLGGASIAITDRSRTRGGPAADPQSS
ncbi:MAG: DMT family transporter [Planctomycetota bacterium]